MTDDTDVTDTIAARSDQLNADDLLSGPITVKFTKANFVTVGDKKVLSSLEYICSDKVARKPWHPCKTMCKVMAHAWGKFASAYIGKKVTLWRDPEVVYAGAKVGGVRISHLSDIKEAFELNLAVSKGKKAFHKFKVLETKPVVAPTETEVAI